MANQLDELNKSLITAFRVVAVVATILLILMVFGVGCNDKKVIHAAASAVVPIPKPVVENPVPPEIPIRAMKYRNSLLREVNYHWGIDQDPALFFGQVHQESAWRPDAASAYAQGLTQFTPATAEWIQSLYPADLTEFCGVRSGCPLDARWAIRAMLIYDKRLYEAFPNSKGDERYAFMLSSYNGGLGWAQREQAASLKSRSDADVWFGVVEKVCLRAKWACDENRDYPRKILFRWRPIYKVWLAR